MSATGLWLSSLVALSLTLVGSNEASASKKKAKVEITTLKLSNLTVETTKKDAKKLEVMVKKVKGVVKVTVLKKKGELTVRHRKAADVEAIKAAVSSAGFAVVEPRPEGDVGDDAGADDDFGDTEG